MNSTYFVFSSPGIQRRLMQSKVSYRFFLLCPKRNAQIFKSRSCKKSLSSVYVLGRTCFNECLLFHVTTGRHYRCSLVILFNRRALAFFETSVLKEVCTLRYLHNNSTVLIPKFQNKASLPQEALRYITRSPHSPLHRGICLPQMWLSLKRFLTAMRELK